MGLASPAGYRESYCYPARHNRWLSLDEAVKGSLEYDELVPHDNGSFASWHLEHRKGTTAGRRWMRSTATTTRSS